MIKATLLLLAEVVTGILMNANGTVVRAEEHVQGVSTSPDGDTSIFAVWSTVNL